MASDADRVRRGCTNKDMRALLLAVMDRGHRYKMTRKGVMFLGPSGGSATTHFTCSDHRAAANFRKSLHHIGITLEKRK